MTGTFGSFGTAISALRAQRIAMDVASNNVANASTPGYTRQRAELEAVGSPAQVGIWSRYDGVGGGVDVAGLTRMADPLLDARARQEHARQSYLDVRQSVLERVEAGIAEPGDNGVAAALADFRSALHDLANNPGQDASRSQLLARANTVADAFRVQAANIDNELGDLTGRRDSILIEVNTAAADLAATNRSIATAALTGTPDNTLLDKRDQLTARLAELAGATTTLDEKGLAQVTVGGVALVSGTDAGVVETPAGGGYQVTDAGGTSTALSTAPTGELGATTELLTTTLPDYRTALDAVAEEFATAMNAQHQLGFDRNGAAGKPLFDFDPTDVAGSLAVAITDIAEVAASGVPGGNLDASNAEEMAKLSGAEGSYQRLVNTFGTEVASSRRAAANQQALTNQVDGAREQLGGVSIDEETVNLLAAQRAYEAASRVITTLDSVLDTLINRTGLVR